MLVHLTGSRVSASAWLQTLNYNSEARLIADQERGLQDMLVHSSGSRV